MLVTSPASPTIPITTPPTSNHMDLFVGDPVKNRDTSEPNELFALMPNTVRMIPPANSAIKMTLFIGFVFRFTP